MQVFKLVNPGHVDRLLAFDELPSDLIAGIRRAPIKGWPRYWVRWFETALKHDFIKYPKPFYFLDYKMVNADKEKWSKISAYVKKMTPPNFRLTDNLLEMSVKVAKDPYTELTIDTEQLPIIPLVKIEIAPTFTPRAPEPVAPKVEPDKKADASPKLVNRKPKKKAEKREPLPV